MQFTKFIKGESNDLTTIASVDYKKSIEFLITDENEAVAGYDKVILLVENGDRKDKDDIIKKLHGIRNDELDHIEILKGILSQLEK